MKMLLMSSVFIASLGAGPIQAQENEPVEPVPLKLELVLTHRQQGTSEERMPYTLYVLADGRGTTTLRTGREVPVPVTTFVRRTGESQEEAQTPTTSFQYRNVGMNVTCNARRHDGRFRVQINLERSSVHQGGAQPSFQTFNSNNELLLAESQSIQFVAGADPVTGDVWSVELTLQVLD